LADRFRRDTDHSHPVSQKKVTLEEPGRRVGFSGIEAGGREVSVDRAAGTLLDREIQYAG